MYNEKKGSMHTTTGHRPKCSRRRPLNRFEMEAPNDINVSSSAKKLKLAESLFDVEVDQAFGNQIIDFIAVFSTLSTLVVCKVCKSDVKFTESGKWHAVWDLN